MNNEKRNIVYKIKMFIQKYTKMDIDGIFIPCPYWSNKLKNGKVQIRGFLNGKGTSELIRKELAKRFIKLSDKKYDYEHLRKFARRERIGIDCSGFIYRVLEELVRSGYRNCQVSSLGKIFSGEIDKTNADTLTKSEYSIQIDKISDIQLGDLIRMMGGRHVMIIIELRDSQIICAHSSNLTAEVTGVHLGIIRIKDKDKGLDNQIWLEKTKNGKNFGEKYFNSKKGDGIFRLRIFN